MSALFLFCLACLLSGWGLRFLSVPTHLLGIGKELFLSIVVLQCLGYLLGPIIAVLYAQNRVYISNAINLVTIWINTAAFCILLRHGFGLLSYVYANLLAFPIGSSIGLICFFNSKQRPRLFPVWPTIQELRDVFSFSGHMFLFSLVCETLMAIPTLVITKLSGLAAMAVFFVSFRPAFFLQRFTVQPFAAVSPRWQQFYVTQNWDKLARELETGLLLIFQYGLTIVTCFVACWKPFLAVWVGSKMYGGALLSCALGLYLLVYLLGGTLSAPFFWAKKITVLNLVQLLELLFAAPLCFLAAKLFNPPTVLLTSVLLTLVFTVTYCWRAGAGFVRLSHGYGPGLFKHWPVLCVHVLFVLLALTWVWFADAMHLSFGALVAGGVALSITSGAYCLKATWKTARPFFKKSAS
jgi:O-antigen/teichoic acid export membrane protein